MSRPTWARWVTRIFLALGIVALVLTIRSTGLVAIGTYFKKIGWGWFAVVILEVAITAMDATAIRAFLSPDHEKIRLRSAVLSQLAGRAVNAVTPSGNLGEAVKVSVLVEHVSQSRAVATILLYNVVSFSVELVTVGVASLVMAIFLPIPAAWRWMLVGGGVLVLVLAFAIYALVRRGLLVSAVRLAARIPVPGLRLIRRRLWKLDQPSRHLLAPARLARWEPRLRGIDDKMRLVEGARVRDRRLGILMVTLSRLTSMTLSFLLLIAMGEKLTIGLVASITVGSFFIYMASALVPMGIGINEGGYYRLFYALGETPAAGTALVLARRVALLVYAAIGLVLVTASETVQRARERQTRRAASSGHLPVLPEVREVRIVTAPPVTPAPVSDIAD
ncbi:MAG: flippase-like domain-containing protein [Deltaproteobacteria bacterium]|nr:MAG: flippase-like domain-containing protein [Deltaproteobacteria bacterium]TMQ10076.1 MAG: flippase-like domain-containing protein [Deltaproteobacteria bacterium]